MTIKRDALFSSMTDEWATPQWLFDELNAEFHFTLDPCATAENAKCGMYYTRAENGLAQDWGNETVFCNPPYGRSAVAWIKKCYLHSIKRGGGYSGYADSCADGYKGVSRVYLRQSRDPFY